MLQRAADLQGRSLTDFVVSSVEAEALRVIEQYQTLQLSIEDSAAFANALLNPPPPNSVLRAAALNYHQALSANGSQS
jgi:uncharacterized protein (DUF1778 family)